jgi:beta-N-acetylhexosaminidase
MHTLETKIGQMFAVGFDGLRAPDYLLDWLAQGRVGGVILFGRNIDTPQQLAALTTSLHQAAKFPLLIGVDQEGGTVARLRQGFSESPGAMALSAGGDQAETRTEQVSQVMAAELRAMGVNWNYAPVVDISYNAANPSVGTRSFGNDKHRVSALAASAVRGFQAGSVAACAKHFPGLGNTPIDTHVALPSIDTSIADLLANDLLPYRAVMKANIASIMTTHTRFLALDAQHPATLSPIVIPRLLRGELGFNGLVTTDCLEMKAISDNYSPKDSAVLAALASVDMILFSHTPELQEAAYSALLDAVRQERLPLDVVEAANARIAAIKARFPAAPADLSQIRTAQHLAVMQEAARAGVTLLHGTLPPDLSGRVALIEFASVLESGIVESGGQTGLARIMRQRAPQIQTLALRSVGDDLAPALALARQSDLLILATRNAHLIAEQREKAQQLVQAARHVAHVCLRNPYDAPLFSAALTLCTCGDSTPSLEAAVDALLGAFTPTGQLPVAVEGAWQN